MTDRERWTVYPLLFLTLGIAVKDKITRITDAEIVKCERMIVQDRAGKQQVVIAATSSGGLMRMEGPKGGLDLLVGQTDRVTGVMFVDAAGNVHAPSIVVARPSAPKVKPAPKPAPPTAEQAPPEQPEQGLEPQKPAAER